MNYCSPISSFKTLARDMVCCCLSEISNSKKLRDQFISRDVVFQYLCISSLAESTIWKFSLFDHGPVLKTKVPHSCGVSSASLARSEVRPVDLLFQ